MNGAFVATRRNRSPQAWGDRVERDGNGMTEQLEVKRAESAREMLLMGLRLAEGIDAERFESRTGIPLANALDRATLARAIEENYVMWKDGTLTTTGEGRLCLDSLLAALVL